MGDSLNSMAAKALLALDIEIALLREQIAHGEGGIAIEARLDQLLAARRDLIPKMLAERMAASSFTAFTRLSTAN